MPEFKEAQLSIENKEGLTPQDQSDINTINNFLRQNKDGENNETATYITNKLEFTHPKEKLAWDNLKSKLGKEINLVADNLWISNNLNAIVSKMELPNTFEDFQSKLNHDLNLRAYPNRQETLFLDKVELFMTNQLGTGGGTIKLARRPDGNIYSSTSRLYRTSDILNVYQEMYSKKLGLVSTAFKSQKSKLEGSISVPIDKYTLGDIAAVKGLGELKNDSDHETQVNNYMKNSIGSSDKTYISGGMEYDQFKIQNLQLDIDVLDSKDSFKKYLQSLDLDVHPTSSDFYSKLKRHNIGKVGVLLNTLGCDIPYKDKSISQGSDKFVSKDIARVVKGLIDRGYVTIEKETRTGVSSEVFTKIIKPRLEKKYPGATIHGPESGVGRVSVGYTMDNIIDKAREEKGKQFTTQMKNITTSVAGVNLATIGEIPILEDGSLTTMRALTDIPINQINKTKTLTSDYFVKNGINNLQDYNQKILSKLASLKTDNLTDLKYTKMTNFVKAADYVESDLRLSKSSLAAGSLCDIQEVKDKYGKVQGYNISTYFLGQETKQQIEKINIAKNVKAPEGYRYNMTNLFPKEIIMRET